MNTMSILEFERTINTDMENAKMGEREFASTIIQMGKFSCVEFVPLDVATVTSVKIQAAIGKHGYQHIEKTEKITVTSLMRTSKEM